MSNVQFIYSERVWINGELRPASIGMANGRIVDISSGRHQESKDFGNLVIMPGVIDAHVHINEPGRTDWEGFDTATKAAAFGGVTTLVDMPLNSSPVTISVEGLHKKQEATQGKLHVNCGFWAGGVGQDTLELKALINEGCLGIKVFLSNSGIDEFPNISISDLDVLMAAFGNANVPVLAHCEFDTLSKDAPIDANVREYMNYLASRPKAWENEAVRTFIQLSAKHHCKAHVVHLASEEILPWIVDQKSTDTPFTVETCPHYILFAAEEIEEGNTLFKCAPPIRKSDTKEELIIALKSGVIDFIASDHSPAPPYLKELETGDFTKAWGGIAGLQFLLPASWTALKTTMDIEYFIPLLTSKPAGFLGLEGQLGEIALGQRADLCIWNPEDNYKVSPQLIQHRHKASPYSGRILYGKVIATYVNGFCIMENDMMLEQSKGRIILREKDDE